MNRPIIHLLGDSLIDFGNWRYRLPEFTVISEGVPGEHVAELLQRLPPASTRLSPDVFVIMTGTNNLLFGDRDFTAAIENIVISLTSNFPRAEIMVTSLLPVLFEQVIPGVISTNKELKAITRRTGVSYLDLYPDFYHDRENMFEYDGVHLSEAGYQLWARILIDKITTKLAKDSD